MPRRARFLVSLTTSAAFLVLLLPGGVIQAQPKQKPDWRGLAQQYHLLGALFLYFEGGGHSVDDQAALLRTLDNLFLVASIPVLPPRGIAPDEGYYATMQPTTGLVTSVIDRRLPDVIPTENVAVFARFDGPDWIVFRGELMDSRKTVLQGRLNRKDRSLEFTVNVLMLTKATERLRESKENCVKQLYKAEVDKCPARDPVGCPIVTWIYANDQCKRVSTGTGSS